MVRTGLHETCLCWKNKARSPLERYHAPLRAMGWGGSRSR